MSFPQRRTSTWARRARRAAARRARRGCATSAAARARCAATPARASRCRCPTARRSRTSAGSPSTATSTRLVYYSHHTCRVRGAKQRYASAATSTRFMEALLLTSTGHKSPDYGLLPRNYIICLPAPCLKLRGVKRLLLIQFSSSNIFFYSLFTQSIHLVCGIFLILNLF